MMKHGSKPKKRQPGRNNKGAVEVKDDKIVVQISKPETTSLFIRKPVNQNLAITFAAYIWNIVIVFGSYC